MFKSTKIRLIILCSVLILLVIGSYWLIKQYQKPSADFGPYEASLNSSAIGAVACKSGATSCNLNKAIGEIQDPNEYPASFPVSIPMAIARYSLDLLEEKRNNCMDQVVNQKLIPNPSTIKLPIQINLPECKITVYSKLISKSTNEIIFSANISTAFKGQAPASFKSIFHNGEISKDENAPSDLDLTAAWKNINFIYRNNKKWDLSVKNSAMNFSGNTDTNYDFKIKGHDDMSGWIGSTPNDPQEINYTVKKWDSYSRGSIYGHINSSWSNIKSNGDWEKPGKITINSLSLCPNGCVMTVEEILELEGDIPKVGENKNPYGHFRKYQQHKEIYEGKAVGDPKTGKLEWTDLILKKDDIRNWKRNISYQKGGCPEPGVECKKIRLLADYSGNSESHSTEYPLQGANHYTVDTTINKNLSVIRDSDNQTEFLANENNKKTKNVDGTITDRSGSGNYSAGTASYAGVYDLPNPDDARMRVTISNVWPVNSRHDPFAENDIARFIQDIVPDRYTAPGFFTASSYDAEKAVIYSKAYKAFPDNLYVFSYAASKPSPATLTELQNLAKEMQIQGVNIPLNVPHNIMTYRKANGQVVHMPEDLANHLAAVKENSWIIFIGEGSPIGFGGETLTWDVLQKMVTKAGKNKHFRFDSLAFANLSCYGGRANVVFKPLGIQVIGSLNFMSGKNITGPVGQLINIDNASWDHSAGSIIQTLDARFKSLSTCKL